MVFLDFYTIGKAVLGKDIMCTSPLVRKIEKNTKTKGQVLQVMVLKYCYGHMYDRLFRNHVFDCMNEFLLDFETPIEKLSEKDIIIVKTTTGAKFCFTIQEICDICLADISRSTLVYDETYKIYTIVKNFRMPVNPYSMTTFTYDQLVDIIQQIVVKTDTLPPDYFALFSFMKQAHQVYTQCQEKSKYETTRIIEAILQEQGYVFKEHFLKPTMENKSLWEMRPKKRVDGNAMYTWFIQHVFLTVSANVNRMKSRKNV